jgi:dTDP-glucose 4,6-dehydratase
VSERFLITGAAGFIGSNFALHLLKNSDVEVHGLDAMKYAANPRTVDKLKKSGVKFIIADLLDQEALEDAVKRCDVVVHFAAESHNDNSIAGPRPFIESNVIGTFNVLEACRRFDKRLHHISTDEVFGDLEIDDPSRFTEATPYNPSSPYSSSKAASDLLVKAWVRTYGLRATISNCSNNFGPYQHVEKFIPRQITNVLMGKKPKLYGQGLNVRDWIYVDLHSDAVLKIIQSGTPGQTYLIGDDGERSNLLVLSTILELMGKSSDWFDFVEDRPGHDLRYAIDSSKLRRDLGWSPAKRSFEADLEDTIAWYRENPTWWEKSKMDAESKYSNLGGQDRAS